MSYEIRNFMIFPVTELSKIDFSQVLETSAETVRVSVDGTLTFVKWDGESMPPCLADVVDKQGPYTYEEIIAILIGTDWTSPMTDHM
jgi:hypothetical protein